MTAEPGKSARCPYCDCPEPCGCSNALGQGAGNSHVCRKSAYQPARAALIASEPAAQSALVASDLLRSAMDDIDREKGQVSASTWGTLLAVSEALAPEAVLIAHRIEVESNFLNGKYTPSCTCGWVGGSWHTQAAALGEAQTAHAEAGEQGG